jgi:O-antigen ligase
MSADAAGPSPARAALTNAGYVCLLVAIGAATLAAVIAGNGDPITTLLPVALVTGAYVLSRIPLRWSASVLLGIMLSVDDHEDTFGQWRTPLAILGDMMHERLDAVLGVPGLAVSGMEVMLLVLAAISLRRRATGSTLDTAGQVRSASALRGLVLLYLAAVLYAEANGLLRGWQVAPWKLRNLLHPLALYLLLQAAFRGPRDHELLGRIVVLAASIRSVLCFVVQRISIAETGGKFAHATSHGDSVLFSVALCLLLFELMERPDRRRRIRAMLLVPLILVGMLENGRRTAWVMVLMTLVFVYLLSPWKGWKRSLTRGVVFSAPILALYLAVGWNRGGSIFAPIATLRGVSDTSVDSSAYWREVENWNIATSMREAPILGIGLGGEYTIHMHNDDISSIYKEYREWPHNTVFGLLLLMGVVAFTAMWVLYAGVVFLSVRSYRLATTADHRVAALGCLAVVIACFVMAYGDTGGHYPQYKILFAIALCVSGKLATATGAWPARPRRGPALASPAAG